MGFYSIKRRNEIINFLYDSGITEKYKLNGLTVSLNKNVLVPHPATLNLIEQASRLIYKNRQIRVIADLGTGSGIIALTLAKRFPRRKFLATDISKDALKIAKNNAKENNIKNVKFLINTDNIWLNEVKNKKIDLIVSNPAFVSIKEYNSNKFRKNYPESLKEPVAAIVTKDKSGLTPYLEIFNNSLPLKVRYLLLQCNSDTLDRLFRRLKKEFKLTFKFKIIFSDGKKRIIFARRG